MSAEDKKKNAGYYRDLSRITLEGLAEISHDFDDFYRDLSARLAPALQDMAQKELPEASDQLNSIVAATETAAENIMDNLEAMQAEQERIRGALEALLTYKRMAPAKKAAVEDGLAALDDSGIRIMKIFEELSFQDLTGQRIRRIVTLVRSIETTVQGILGSVEQRMTAAPPADEKPRPREAELKGPQDPGEGMDQAAIDALLADL